ncbi:hypothetical protein YC2023_099255 [Brassica napus]
MAKKKRTQFQPLSLTPPIPAASTASSKSPPSRNPPPSADSSNLSGRRSSDSQSSSKLVSPASGGLAGAVTPAVSVPTAKEGTPAPVGKKPLWRDVARPNPSKSDQVTTNKKKKKQKRKRAEKAVFAPILDLTGTLEIDIGLDKLKENKDQTSKVPTVDDQKDDADIGKQQQPSSSSSSSSEDTASSEPDTSEYSSEEMSSSKEEGEYTTVVSKKTRKLLLQQQKKASSSKKKKLPRGTRPPSS